MPNEYAPPPFGSVQIVGPFESHYVVIDGWRVPHLTAHPANGGIVHLTLDDRFGLDVQVADMERVIPFIADCIAVAKGYSCHPREGWEGPIEKTPFVRMVGIEIETKDPTDD